MNLAVELIQLVFSTFAYNTLFGASLHAYFLVSFCFYIYHLHLIFIACLLNLKPQHTIIHVTLGSCLCTPLGLIFHTAGLFPDNSGLVCPDHWSLYHVGLAAAGQSAQRKRGLVVDSLKIPVPP